MGLCQSQKLGKRSAKTFPRQIGLGKNPRLREMTLLRSRAPPSRAPLPAPLPIGHAPHQPWETPHSAPSAHVIGYQHASRWASPCLSACASLPLPACLTDFACFACFACVCLLLPVYLSTCLPVYLSACLPVCLSAGQSGPPLASRPSDPPAVSWQHLSSTITSRSCHHWGPVTSVALHVVYVVHAAHAPCPCPWRWATIEEVGQISTYRTGPPIVVLALAGGLGWIRHCHYYDFVTGLLHGPLGLMAGSYVVPWPNPPRRLRRTQPSSSEIEDDRTRHDTTPAAETESRRKGRVPLHSHHLQ
jgi:hypothetical protein